jgi:hypothetical protein
MGKTKHATCSKDIRNSNDHDCDGGIVRLFVLSLGNWSALITRMRWQTWWFYMSTSLSPVVEAMTSITFLPSRTKEEGEHMRHREETNFYNMDMREI